MLALYYLFIIIYYKIVHEVWHELFVNDVVVHPYALVIDATKLLSVFGRHLEFWG